MQNRIIIFVLLLVLFPSAYGVNRWYDRYCLQCDSCNINYLYSVSVIFANVSTHANNVGTYLGINNAMTYEAGINMRAIKNVAKLLKEWKGFQRIEKWLSQQFQRIKQKCYKIWPSLKKEPLKKKNPEIKPVYADKILELFNSINSVEDIEFKIWEYLSMTPQNNHNTVKTIACFRQDVDKIRCILYQENFVRMEKILKTTNEGVKISEYDFNNMRETYFFDANGIEYACFQIPRIPCYILSKGYPNRIRERLSFTIRKDDTGRWEKIRDILNEIFSKPTQFWDEILFRKELKKMKIAEEDIKEIEEYQFVKNDSKQHVYLECVEAQVA